MSTKIYDGGRLRDGVDLFAFAANVRAAIGPAEDKIEAREVLADAVFACDAADFQQEVRPDSALADAFMRGVDRHRLRRQSGDEGGFSFCAAPDPLTGRTLLLPFTEQRELQTLWETLPDVEEYGYWNNTDQPDDVTDDEWDERRAAWDRVLGSDPPVERMATFRVRGTYSGRAMGLISERDPSLNELGPSSTLRARRILHRAVVSAVQASIPEDLVSHRSLSRATSRISWRVVDENVEQVETLLDPHTLDFVLAPPDARPPARHTDATAFVDIVNRVMERAWYGEKENQ